MNLSQQEKRAKWREEYRRYHPVKPARTFYQPKTGRIVVHDHYATRIFWNQQMLQFLKQNFATMLNADLAEWLGVSQRTMIRKARELELKKDTAWLKGIWDERRRMAVASTKVNGNSGCIKKGQHLSPGTEFKKKTNITTMEIEKIIYKAKDGRTFFDPIECEEYEKTIGVLKGSVGELVNELQKNCKEEQYVSGIILVRNVNGTGEVYVRYTGCIDHKLEDYVNVDNLKEEQRYESATIGELINRLKQLDKDLPCQYTIVYSDNIDMYDCGMMANYNAAVWNKDKK